VSDADDDSDNTANCDDECPTDPNKQVSGECGCFVSEVDRDSDNTPDCNDQCPDDPNKIVPGNCGCGNPEDCSPPSCSGNNPVFIYSCGSAFFSTFCSLARFNSPNNPSAPFTGWPTISWSDDQTPANQIAVSCDQPANYQFQLGPNTMTCTGTDLYNNVGTCSVTVTLVDTEFPVISCDTTGIPATINSGDAAFSWSVTSVDDFSGTQSTITPAGPYTFNPTCNTVGPHMFTYQAVDQAGNSLAQTGASQCSVSFTVNEVYTWDVKPWGTCSTTCGAGVQTRNVFCRDSCGNSVPFSNCDDYDGDSTNGRQEPVQSQACNLGDCAPNPTVSAVLSRVQVTVDDSTGTDIFTLNIEFITGSNQPHQVATATGEGSGDNGATGAVELSSLSNGCTAAFSLTNPQLCFQTFRYSQTIDCDMSALEFKFTLETQCLATGCSLADLFTVTLSLDATNYCEVELTGVELTGTLTALTPGFNMAAWSAARAADIAHPVPTAVSQFGVQDEILGFIQIDSTQVIIQNLRVISAVREGYSNSAMTGTPDNSDAIVTNFVAQAGLSASKYDADVPANQGPAGGSTGPFSAQNTAFCAIKWTEPTAAGNAAGEIGAQETEYVKITADIQVDYLLTNNQATGRRRVLRAEMEPNKLPVLSWLPEQSVDKYMQSRRSLLQAADQTAETRTLGQFQKSSGFVAPNKPNSGVSSSTSTEGTVPPAVWYALISVIILSFCVCVCIGLVCVVAFKNKEAIKTINGYDNDVEGEPEVNIYLSPMPQRP
jgi:hypothetical protein